MSSVCISNCVNDARDPRVPVRATYVNLYKWPESDAEFIKSVRRVAQGLHDKDNSSHHHHHHHHRPRVVDSVSCRQMYLRSYTFSRKESVPERTKKCFGKVKEKVANRGKKRKDQKGGGKRRKKCFVLRRVKEVTCNALFRIFHRLLSCAASVDVVDQVN